MTSKVQFAIVDYHNLNVSQMNLKISFLYAFIDKLVYINEL